MLANVGKTIINRLNKQFPNYWFIIVLTCVNHIIQHRYDEWCLFKGLAKDPLIVVLKCLFLGYPILVSRTCQESHQIHPANPTVDRMDRPKNMGDVSKQTLKWRCHGNCIQRGYVKCIYIYILYNWSHTQNTPEALKYLHGSPRGSAGGWVYLYIYICMFVYRHIHIVRTYVRA